MRKVVTLAILVLAAIGVTSCWPSSQRYRITATVDVDGVKYSGSAVQKLTCHRAWQWAQSLDTDRCAVDGAAAAVNVAGRGYLFVLRDGWDLNPNTGKRYNFQMTTYVEDLFASAGVDPFGAQSWFPSAWNVDAAHMPVMATFSDLNDPASIKQVEPGDLSATFGPNVYLVSLTVSKTWEQPTPGMNEQLLPWIHQVHGYFTGDGAKDYSKFSTVIDASSF